MTAPLEGVTVLDLASEKGAYCGKLMADLGASVTKVEDPAGDRMRLRPPFKDDVPHPDGSLAFAYYQANKRGITLDLCRPESAAILERLVRGADVLVESFTPDEAAARGLAAETVRAVNPAVIHCSITAFGKTGPYRSFRSTHLTSHALGGGLIASGPADGPPVTIPGNQFFDLTSIHATYAVLVALRNRPAAGGQFIDMSAHDLMALLSRAVQGYARGAAVARRTGEGRRQAPSGTWDAKDGQVNISVVNPSHWEGIAALLENPPLLADPAWNDRTYRAAHAKELEAVMASSFASRAKAEIAERAQELHIPAAPINTLPDYVEDGHTRARGSFVDVEHPRLGRYRTPGAPVRFSEPIWGIRRPAPSLGEHNDDVYVRELGYSPETVAGWRAGGLI